MVSEGNKVDVILPDLIDDVVRKTQNDPWEQYGVRLLRLNNLSQPFYVPLELLVGPHPVK
jgi:hypothetical protein